MKLVRIAACAAVLAGAPPLHAQNMGFMQNSPAEFMDKEDTKLLMSTSMEALNRNADGETSGWVNPKTGASGTVTPLKSLTQKGMKCRDVAYTNKAGGFKNTATHTWCRVASGQWKLLN